MDLTPVTVDAQLDIDCVPGYTRYLIDLPSAADPSVSRKLIVDVPDTADGTCDVWVADASVAVGDTPADGFATYTPTS